MRAGRLAEDAAHLCVDGLYVGPDQAGCSGCERLGTVRALPQHQHGFTKGRGLLLEPPESVRMMCEAFMIWMNSP